MVRSWKTILSFWVLAYIQKNNAAQITPFEISRAQQNAFRLLVPKLKIRKNHKETPKKCVPLI